MFYLLYKICSSQFFFPAESGDQTYSISGAVYNHAISDSDDPGLLHNVSKS